MLGINGGFVATTGSALDSTERGGKVRYSLRAAIRMPKRRKDDADYGTQWANLNISEFNSEYAKAIAVGTQVVVFGRIRTSVGDDGRTFMDVDVTDITAMPKRDKAAPTETADLDW